MVGASKGLPSCLSARPPLSSESTAGDQATNTLPVPQGQEVWSHCPSQLLWGIVPGAAAFGPCIFADCATVAFWQQLAAGLPCMLHALATPGNIQQPSTIMIAMTHPFFIDVDVQKYFISQQKPADTKASRTNVLFFASPGSDLGSS